MFNSSKKKRKEKCFIEFKVTSFNVQSFNLQNQWWQKSVLTCGPHSVLKFDRGAGPGVDRCGGESILGYVENGLLSRLKKN